MSKKKKQNKETTIENFYDLKTDKVDELVAALKGDEEAPQEPVNYNIDDLIGEEASNQGEETTYRKKGKEFNPYKLDKLSRVPTWIKAVFIKWWFAGLVFYLIGIGLGSVITNDENRMLLSGVILGIVVDVLVNPVLMYFRSTEDEYDGYIMFPFPFKKYWTFLTNIVYYIVVVICVLYMYRGFNELISLIAGTSGQQYIYVGVEPLLFGVFAVIADMAFIGIKDLIVYLVKRGKRKKAAAGVSGADTTPPDTTSYIPAESNTETENVPSSEEPVDEVERLRLLAERQEQEEKPKRNKNKKDSK